MPQLETTTYLTQYRWALIALVSLFSYLVILVLPVIKTNFLIRRSINNLFIFKSSDFYKRFDLLWEKTKYDVRSDL